MIEARILREIKKAKCYQIQIARYTRRNRNLNKLAGVLILFACTISAISAFLECVKWVPVTSSIIATLCTAAKEWVYFIFQPEKEMEELDKIRDFYIGYENKLDSLFRKKCCVGMNISTEDASKEYDKILDTVEDRETKMYKLCRPFFDCDRIKAEEQVKEIMNYSYHGHVY